MEKVRGGEGKKNPRNVVTVSGRKPRCRGGGDDHREFSVMSMSRENPAFRPGEDLKLRSK